MSSREQILAQIRAALGGFPATEPVDVDRGYLDTHTPDEASAMLELLHENLADYRAHVHRSSPEDLPGVVAGLLSARGSRSVAVPTGLDERWLSETEVLRVPDDPPLTAAQLDGVDSVVTSCALAIAETGTIVLDCGPGQGRRALTLVPDHHICVVTSDQIVASVPRALGRLDPLRAQTWISGPSATSDIELDRVEGVHGPRRLDVVLLPHAL